MQITGESVGGPHLRDGIGIVSNLGAGSGDTMPTTRWILRRRTDKRVGLQPCPSVGETGQHDVHVRRLGVPYPSRCLNPWMMLLKFGSAPSDWSNRRPRSGNGRFRTSSYARTMTATLSPPLTTGRSHAE